MIFLLAAAVLSTTNFVLFFRSAVQRQIWFAVAHLHVSLLLSVSTLYGVAAHAFMRETPIATNLAVYGLALGAVASFVLILARYPKTPGIFSWKKFAYSAVAMCSVIMATDLIDHAWFFRDSDKSGVAYTNQLADVQCPANLILFSLATEPARYRCPISIVFGPYTQSPFAPAYIEGESASLGAEIRRMFKQP